MSTPQAQNFFSEYRIQTFRKGSVLLMPSNRVSHAMFLEKGIVAQYAITDAGNRINITTYKAGTFFPMLSIIDDSPNRFYFEVMSGEASVRMAPADAVVAMLRANPEVMYDLLARMYRGLDGVLDRLIAHMSGSAESRVCTELRIYVERFGTATENGMIEVQVTDQELASQTGMARETVSRVMAELKARGVVERMYKGLRIDAEKLRALPVY